MHFNIYVDVSLCYNSCYKLILRKDIAIVNFLDQLALDTNKGVYTENGAVTNLSTLDPLLDFFSRAGAMREREAEAVELFKRAFSQDKESAVRCLFYLRDIRGGQGERSVFRAILKELNSLDKETLQKVVKFIPEYGRWDEILEVFDGNEELISKIISSQLEEDEKNMKAKKSISLLAKWLPSENASSKNTKLKARKIATSLGLIGDPITTDNTKEFKTISIPNLSPYRRKIGPLRKYIKLLEQKMSSKEWQNIEYDKIPSQAHRRHVKAFMRHDEERYREFLGAVEKGEKKINAQTIFTYEIYEMVQGYSADPSKEKTANALWEALPDYTKGDNAIVLADVSGSMSGRPMSISVSLALYFAERNKGPFKDYFMTFSAKPQLVNVQGSNIKDKFDFIRRTHWDMNTNVEAAFKAILDAAVKSRAKQEEVPKTLYIISDMEFDSTNNYGYIEGNEETNFERAQKMFEAEGYKLPHLVFWNVNARNDQSPATKFDKKVTLISGSNQSTFQYVVQGKDPMTAMLDILTGDRYENIRL